jgi:hypothetical protein
MLINMLRIREEPVKPGYLSNKIVENLHQMLPMVRGALTNSGVAISAKVKQFARRLGSSQRLNTG